jgi:nucleoside 2-deoxyribosyltransferase
MPFSEEMEDVFYYGIQNPVRQLGYVCERVDQEAFTGDILEQVKMRIENAEIVIADLTGSNPNVYLEVGYAWGKGRPTVLVANKKDELKFDVRGQKCLKYQSIKDLEKLLTTELKSLGAKG